jgi:hypothetical protein
MLPRAIGVRASIFVIAGEDQRPDPDHDRARSAADVATTRGVSATTRAVRASIFVIAGRSKA